MESQTGSLNTPNVCAGLIIEQVDYTDPFGTMYEMQEKFQTSLGRTFPAISLTQSISNTIYWQYCIFNELEELVLWESIFEKQDIPVGTIIFDETNNIKEARMEVIDVLHFVFNIGLEFGFSAGDIAGIEGVTANWSSIVLTTPYEAITRFRRQVIGLIDLLPWKAWKTYPQTTMEDIKLNISPIYRDMVVQLFSLCIHLGMSRQDCINYYVAKMKENIRRQSDGY